MKCSKFIVSITYACLIQILLSANASASISRTNVDLGKSTELRIGPGRISVLKLPEAIAETKVGAPRKLKVLLSSSDPTELTLFWIEPQAYRTNLIIRTTKRTFIFDVIPVTKGHQDLVEVRGAYGAPAFISENQKTNRANSNGNKSRTIHQGRIE
ncbi:MAG: hypothetical protein U1E10_16185 [Bdellovibrionales bacterium]|nr:hypothetical protein [Bdellovibrionales bacterium]